ncbi:MAG: glycosyltransferase family 2 protein [Candidatus Lokiarchaeia archaeon]
MSKSIVSIIIPTFKRNQYLKRAINSVLNQTFNEFEIIVVDDNNEGSRYRKLNEKLMEDYKDNEKIIYIKHQQNLNGAAARNTGIKFSKSKYIAFLDDDDEYLPEKIELQINLLEKLDKTWGAVYCGYSIYRKNKLLQRNLNLGSGNLKKKLLLMETPIGGCSTLLMKRSILKELDGFDIAFSRHQDWELLIRFFRRYRIAYVNRILVKMHLDDRRNITDPESIVLLKEKYLRKFKKDIEEMPIRLQKEIYKRHYLQIARSYIENKNFNKALKYYKKSKNYSKILSLDYVKLILTLVDSIIPIKSLLLKIIMIFSRNFFPNRLLKAFNR